MWHSVAAVFPSLGRSFKGQKIVDGGIEISRRGDVQFPRSVTPAQSSLKREATYLGCAFLFLVALFSGPPFWGIPHSFFFGGNHLPHPLNPFTPR